MSSTFARKTTYFELELELVQFHMAQKPVLRGEVGARVRVIRAYVLLRRHHHPNLSGYQSTPTCDCGTDACLCAFVAMLLKPFS